MSTQLTINGVAYEVDAEPDTPLLWVLRDHLNMTGTKFGCGIAQCGACTVHIDGAAMRSCSYPLSAAAGKDIKTIEGNNSSEVGEALQKAWDEHAVVQCGYCQSGQLMSATALLQENAKPDDEAIDQAMRGNICRCNTYVRIRAAIKAASADLS